MKRTIQSPQTSHRRPLTLMVMALSLAGAGLGCGESEENASAETTRSDTTMDESTAQTPDTTDVGGTTPETTDGTGEETSGGPAKLETVTFDADRESTSVGGDPIVLTLTASFSDGTPAPLRTQYVVSERSVLETGDIYKAVGFFGDAPPAENQLGTIRITVRERGQAQAIFRCSTAGETTLVATDMAGEANYGEFALTCTEAAPARRITSLELVEGALLSSGERVTLRASAVEVEGDVEVAAPEGTELEVRVEEGESLALEGGATSRGTTDAMGQWDIILNITGASGASTLRVDFAEVEGEGLRQVFEVMEQR